MSNQRRIFIQRIFRQLNPEDYILLKYTESSLEELDDNTDLDLLLSEPNWQQLKNWAEEDRSVVKVNWHRQSFMCQLFIHFEDGGFLQIDCIFQLIRKNLVYLSNDYLFANVKVVDQVKTYSTFCLLEHLVFFNCLNYSGLAKKYISYFENLSLTKQNSLLEKFNKKYGCEITAIHHFSTFDKSLRTLLMNYLRKDPANRGITQLKHKINYAVDSVKNLAFQRGFLISFTGVDGAGKSTILECTRQLLSEKFRKKTVVIRHRPSLLPILSSWKYGKATAEKRAATTLPRQGSNSSQFNSFLRFAYYYLDFLIGRAYVFCRYQMRNYIVLYDRYYFDFIIDGKRTNLALDQKIPKWLYRFVQKPRLNFFLYAPVNTILSRKKELTPEAIESLTSNYKALFHEFDSTYQQKYVPIKNIHKEETLQTIFKQINNIL